MIGQKRLAPLAATFLASLFAASSTRAVVVSTTLENDTAPLDDPGWSNIAAVGGSTGVYLGNRWMLTAFHVGAADAVFPEIGRFHPNPATQVQIENPVAGLTTHTDLLMYQLTEDPGLPSLTIATTTPKPGTDVIIAGFGRDRETAPTFWTTTQDGEEPTWSESNEADSEYQGYRTLFSNTIRWGTNLVEGDSLIESQADINNVIVAKAVGLDVITTITEFDLKGTVANERIKGPDRQPDTEFEAQAVLNDSGGPMFFKEDDEWVLGGIILAVDGFEGQPDPTVTAVHGNITFYADIPSYRDQILGNLNIQGDFNQDGQLTSEDIDLLSAALESDDLTFDLNTDNLIDDEDHRAWVEDLRFTFFGDANLDGEFNSADMVLAFRNALYETGNSATWESGDWNGDRLFNSRDFVVALQTASFEKGPRSAGPRIQNVPEPFDFTPMAVAFGMLVVSLAGRRKIPV
ncbi:trypsin-like serine protease [Planctomycetota bacterium]